MPWCAGCKKECAVKQVDNGIGPYEFWGQRGTDRRVEFVSDCCEEDLTYEDGSEYDASGDDFDDEADRRYDEMRDREDVRGG